MPDVDCFLGIGTEKYNIRVCKAVETSLEEEVWRCLAGSLWRGWGEFWGLGVPFAGMLLGEAVFIWCFPFLGSAVEGEGFPCLPWQSAGLCRQDMGREGEEDNAPAAGPGHFWTSRSSGCGRGAGVQASPERLGLGVCVIWGKVRRDFLGERNASFLLHICLLFFQFATEVIKLPKTWQQGTAREQPTNHGKASPLLPACLQILKHQEPLQFPFGQ